jgi:hypothetical protein
MSENSFVRSRSALVAVSLVFVGCGGAGAVAPPADPSTTAEARRPASSTPTAATHAGSSDGMSCEDAQAQNVDEIDMRGGGQADLTAKDYAPVLNNGGYLSPCEVPETSKIQICVAVRGGAAVGVTVTIDPSSPDLELCVAKQVRALSFASHPKMDIVKVQF